MPNQVKENKSEKKFKGEILGIKDKLQIISWLFGGGSFIKSLFVGNHDYKETKKNVKQIGKGISLLKYI